MYEFKLYLYAAGRHEHTQQVIADLTALLEDRLPGQYVLEFVDILERPDVAMRDKVFATPTLVKTAPPPESRIVGDLANGDLVLTVLGLMPQATS